MESSARSPSNPWQDLAAPFSEWVDQVKCISYSAHARRRLLSLRIGEAEVKRTLREPLVVHPGNPLGRPSTVVVGEHIRVVTEPGTLHVITVTLRSRSRYVHGVHDRFNPPSEPATAA